MAATTTAPAVRPKPDRFLLGILIGIAALLVLAGITEAALRQPARQLPADIPGGTVQRFFNALEQQDYDQAYDLLGDSMSRKPARDTFVRYQLDRGSNDQAQRRIRIESERVNGDSATVTVRITIFYTGGPPFGRPDEYGRAETFGLQREGGTWRITSLPSGYLPYWYR